MRIFILFTFLMVLLLFLFPHSFVYASNYLTINVSDDGSSIKSITKIVQDELIWVDSNSQGQQVMLFDGFETRQLTFDDYPLRHMDPHTDGEHVVWVKEDGSVGTDYTPQVFMYDVDNGITTQVTSDNLYLKHDAYVNEGRIVWRQLLKESPVGNWHFAMYDMETGGISLLGLEGDSPRIYGNNIAWVCCGNTERDVYIQNLLTGEVQRLTDDGYTDNGLVESGGRLMWQKFDNDSEVMIYNGERVLRVTDNDRDDQHPGFGGDLVAWNYTVGFDSEMAVYDFVKDEYLAFLPGPGIGGAMTDGKRVGFIRNIFNPDLGRESREIFVLDLETGEESQLTDGAAFVVDRPFMSDEMIAWVGQNTPGGTQQVYVAKEVPEALNKMVKKVPEKVLFDKVWEILSKLVK